MNLPEDLSGTLSALLDSAVALFGKLVETTADAIGIDLGNLQGDALLWTTGLIALFAAFLLRGAAKLIVSLLFLGLAFEMAQRVGIF